MQTVGESFELGAVVGDGEVPLIHIAEFRLVEDGVLHLVVMVEVVDARPEGEGICLLLGRANDVQHLRGAGGVDSIDDAAVDLVPVSITIDDRSGGRDECVEAEFTEGRVKKHLPVIIVGIRELYDANMRANVHDQNGIGGGS
jgi:hypothetical protein